MQSPPACSNARNTSESHVHVQQSVAALNARACGDTIIDVGSIGTGAVRTFCIAVFDGRAAMACGDNC